MKDLVVRTETNKLVTDLVDFDRVQSLLLMILYRRRYLAERERAQLVQMGQSGGEYLRLSIRSSLSHRDWQTFLQLSWTTSRLRRR